MKNKYEIRGDVTAIFITRNDGTELETIIDTSDLTKVDSFPGTWSSIYVKSMDAYYVKANRPMSWEGPRTVILTRWITEALQEMVVDHFNHNTLDNRRENLRVVTQAENCQNTSVQYNNLYSGIRGVTWDKKCNRWHASINHNGKRWFCGLHERLEDADRSVKIGRSQLMPYSLEAVEFKGNQEDVFASKDRPSNYKKYKAPKGIYWDKKISKWWVMLVNKKKRHSFGYYTDLEEAIKVANEARKKLNIT